jgi:hydroxymethylbilane synthase
MACVEAERALVHALGASCNTPVGAYGRPVSGDQIELTAWVGLPDGSAWLHDRVCEAPGVAGELCAQRMLAAGAEELLREAERVLAP